MGVDVGRLGYPGSAREFMRAGWAYAIAIDHRPAHRSAAERARRCRLYRERAGPQVTTRTEDPRERGMAGGTWLR